MGEDGAQSAAQGRPGGRDGEAAARIGEARVPPGGGPADVAFGKQRGGHGCWRCQEGAELVGELCLLGYGAGRRSRPHGGDASEDVAALVPVQPGICEHRVHQQDGNLVTSRLRFFLPEVDEEAAGVVAEQVVRDTPFPWVRRTPPSQVRSGPDPIR